MQDLNGHSYEYNDKHIVQSNSVETVAHVSNPTFKEMSDVEESPNKKTVKPKFDYKKVLSAIMTVVMAGVGLGVSVIVPIADGQSPLSDVLITVQELGAIASGEVFFHFEISAKAPFEQIPLEARLYNDFTSRSIPLEVIADGEYGYASGSFDGLKVGITYTLAVVGKSTLGSKEIFSQKVTIPHPIEDAYANFVECGIDGNDVFFAVNADSTQPLEIVLLENDVEKQRIPFDLTESGTLEGNPTAPYVGVMNGTFSQVDTMSIVKMQVVGKGLFDKQYVVAEYIFDPLMYAYADVLEVALEGTTLHFTVDADSAQPLEIILLENDVEKQRIPFDLTEGGTLEGNPTAPYVGVMNGTFQNVTLGVDYTIQVVGDDLEGNEQVLVEYQLPIENQ